MVWKMWQGDVSADWGAPANWLGDAVPGSADVASFDDETSSNSCVVDRAVDVLGITLDNYTGTLDLGDTGEDIQVGTSGFLIDTGTVDMGDADVTITNGDFNYVNCGTFVAGTSLITLVGTCTVTSHRDKTLYDWATASGSAVTIAAGSVAGIKVTHSCSLGGTVTIADSGDCIWIHTDCDLTIAATAVVNGPGYVILNRPTSGHGLTSLGSGASFNALLYIDMPAAGSVLGAGTYGPVKVRVSDGTNSELRLSGGGYSFTGLELETTAAGSFTLDTATNGTDSITVNGDLLFDDQASTITVDNTGVEADWTVGGDISKTGSGTVNWLKGDGILTCSGSTATPNWNLYGWTVEDIVVNKPAGTLTFSGGWTADSFDAVQGTVDFNGQTLQTTGQFRIQGGASIVDAADAMNGTSLTVGGAFVAVGQDFQATLTGWTLIANGSASAHNCTFERCDASGGNTVLAYNCVDGGNNQNIRFQALAGSRIQTGISMCL